MTTHPVAKLIQAELKQAKATKEELADFLNLPVGEIDSILDGKRKPTVPEGIALAQFFDLNPMLFLGGK
jgi:hypothetical protein